MAYEVTSPGRVNLVGEHTDYTGGYVMPLATNLHTRLVAEPAADVDVYSAALDRRASFSVGDVDRADTWADYVRGVYYVLDREGYAPGGFRGHLDGSLPLGSGLSSSASLELAVLAFLDEAYDLGIDPEEAARLGQRVENEFVGVSCGIMDQFAVGLSRAGHVLHLDTESLEYDQVAFPEDVQVVVFHTGVERELKDSAYNRRRETVERALDRLGRETSKAVTATELASLPARERKRLGFVTRENRRVLRARDALSDGDAARLGDVLVAAHRDIARNFEASCEELDAFVEAALDAGAYGARLTGAGWGGSAVALVDADEGQSFVERVSQRYEERFPDLEPTAHLIRPSAGVTTEHREGLSVPERP